MTQHELKTWPEFYKAIANGSKSFELRKYDRDFKVGDTLLLKEYDPDNDTYSGRQTSVLVTFIIADPTWVQDRMCCMSIKHFETTPAELLALLGLDKNGKEVKV